jgi:diguanylate cyclase (GGDEF)-like protein
MARSVPSARSYSAMRHVVVVDDSQTNLIVLGELIEALPDATAHAFATSLEALAWSAGHDVDCFVLDFHMPSPNGLEMTRLLRADPKHREVPIVMVTGESDLDTRTQVLTAGANDFVMRPVRRDELMARLTTLLALHDARKLLALRVEELEKSLVDSEDRARRHARRLEALWHIANNPSLRGEQLVLAMLSQAAAALRPGESFSGLLGRIEDGYVTLLSAACGEGMRVPKVGTRAPTTETAVVSQLQAGRRRAWEDLEGTGTPHPLGWKSVISTQILAGDATYSMTFAAAVRTAAPFGSDDFAYLEVIGTFLVHQLQLAALANVLRDSEERSREHAERLEAFSRIVNNPQLHDDELWLAMLRQGAASIRPGMWYRGLLARIEGDQLVVEAITEPNVGSPSSARWSVGSVVPLRETIAGQLIEGGGGTRSWDESQLRTLAAVIPQANQWGSYIATTFVAGGNTYVLGFAALEPPTKQFGAQDDAYIDVLASFFASRLQQNWQFDRIQYQQSHDVLTGLLNRSQFRSRARLLNFQTGSERYALVLLDVNALRAVNETYGHMMGDALLVEVASALRSRARGDEFAGRIGGDVFGVFIPDAPTRAEVLNRARDFSGAFSKPFSTGDREGKDFIALSASIGLAVAPEDGRDLDTIFSHADAALIEAKKCGPGSIFAYTAD